MSVDSAPEGEGGREGEGRREGECAHGAECAGGAECESEGARERCCRLEQGWGRERGRGRGVGARVALEGAADAWKGCSLAGAIAVRSTSA